MFSVGLALFVVGLFVARVIDDPVEAIRRGGEQTPFQALIGWVTIIGAALMLVSLCTVAWKYLP